MASDDASVGAERGDEYIAELDSVRAKADAALIKASELEGATKALEARLSQVEEISYKDRVEKEELKQKLEKCEAEIEKSRKTDELNLIPFISLRDSSESLHAAKKRKLSPMEISDLPEVLLVKILSFLPTRVAVSTSILSKQWEFLWMWLPNLEFDCNRDSVRDFINKNLPLHKAPLIKSLRLSFRNRSVYAGDCKTWVGTAVSRGLQELSIQTYYDEATGFLPGSLYTCNTLVTLELRMIFVDVPENVRLPSLKKLHLDSVTYSNGDSLRLLLSCSPILEDLLINRESYDNGTALVITFPSLKRLSLSIDGDSSDYGCVIFTPSLKYIKFHDYRENCSYSFEDMPEIEEADISVLVDSHLGDIFKSISTVRSLSLQVINNGENEAVYGNGIVYSKLENLKVDIFSGNWSKITFQLLKDSPNLQVLDLIRYEKYFEEYEPIDESLVPECLLKSLKTFKFRGYAANDEEGRDFSSFIMKHACCLESTSISSCSVTL